MSCNHPKPITRRQALSLMGGGFGLVALSNMLNASIGRRQFSTVTTLWASIPTTRGRSTPP